jgi:hypothetical protein
MTTAIVTLEEVHLQTVDDLTQHLMLVAERLGEATSGPSATRLYGQGNSRRRSAPGILRIIPVTFELVTRPDREMLMTWVEHELFLLMREPRGRVAYGGFASKSMQITELPANLRSTISGDFEQVSPPPGPVIT